MYKNTSGFTIIELLVIIAVIGILSTISVLSFNRFQANSRDSQRSSSVVIIAEALEKYYDANGEYPSCNSMTSAGNSVALILGGVDQKALVAPRAVAAKTNSIDFCTSLAPGVTTDSFAYVGDGSAECTTTGCLSYILQYKEEGTGSIISLASRRQVNIATSGVPVLNAAPAGFSQVNLNWSAVNNAASYTVQYATDSGFSANLVAQSVAGTSLSLPGLTSGVTYFFRVQAVNGSSASGWSNVRTIMVNFTTLTWEAKVGAGTRNFYGVTLSDNGTRMAATSYNGFIYTSVDSGVTWTERTSSGSRPWWGIASSADGTRLIAAAATNFGVTPNIPGGVFLSANSGATWTQAPIAAPGETESVATSANGAILASAGGSVYTSIDSGTTWIDRSPNTLGGWYGNTLSPNGTILAVKQGSNLYISTNSGVTWVVRSAYSTRFAISADGTKLVTANNGGYIYTSINSGVTWTERTAAGFRNWRTFTSSDDGTKLVAFDNSPGHIYTSVDSGVTWTAQTSTAITYRQGIDSTPDGSKIIVGPSSGNVFVGIYSP